MSRVFALAISVSILTFAAYSATEGETVTEVQQPPKTELQGNLNNAAFLAGSWQVERHADPLFQPGGEGKGRFEVFPALDGRALVGTMDLRYPDKDFKALGVLSMPMPKNGAAATPAAERYAFFWTDSLGYTQYTENVRIEKDKIVAEFEAPMKMRVTYSKVSPERIELVLETDSGEGYKKMLTDVYTKEQIRPLPTTAE